VLEAYPGRPTQGRIAKAKRFVICAGVPMQIVPDIHPRQTSSHIEQGIINDHAGPSAERAKRVESGRGTDISDTHDIGKEVVTHTRIGPAPVTLDAKEGAATLKIVPSLGTAGKGIIRSNESSRLIGKIEGK